MIVMVEVAFEKIVPEGKALGFLDGRACFAIGPLPGETARVSLIQDKRRYTEAVLEEVVVASEHRRPGAEEHFLSCSPWQGVDYDYQLELKRQMLAETFARPELRLPVTELVPAPQMVGYRNKLEFALAADSSGRLSLAFHARRNSTELISLPHGCRLGTEAMNRVALGLLERLNALDVADYARSLTVRRAEATGRLLAVVGVREAPERDWSRLAVPGLSGLVVSRVRPGRRPQVLWHRDEAGLAETVVGVELSYAYDGFFQTNVPMFERALARILVVLPRDGRVVDLYGGVGAIGIPAARECREVVGVEIDAAAVERANMNARRADLANYHAQATPAERLDPAVLVGADCVVVDPPRAGLHHRVAQALLEAAPKRIVYLSCNPATQARDLMRLAETYRAEAVTGFDFYPSTLHLESLAILERVR